MVTRKTAKKTAKKVAKKAAGRPAYKPTGQDREFVDRAVMAGSTIEDISAALNIHKQTLSKHFRFEILTARERLKGEAMRVMMDALVDGSLDAAKFVLARRAGWTEKQEHEHTGPNGGPVQMISLSKEEYKQARQEMLADDDC